MLKKASFTAVFCHCGDLQNGNQKTVGISESVTDDRRGSVAHGARM